MKKILIIEDDNIFALSLKLSLLKSGFEVLNPVDTAEEGYNTAIEHKPDVILMDVFLKGKSTGIDAALNINNNFPIPIIFITGNENLLKYEELKSLDNYRILSKPVDDHVILDTIGALVNKE